MPFRTEEDSLQGAILSADHDITHILSGAPGSFVYDFGAFGWPTSWSFNGLSPQAVQLYFGPIPFNDLLTGRPRYDLLPTALLRYPKIDPGLPDAVVGIQTELRTVDTRKPYTQLHYQAGGHGLQRVTGLHAQQSSSMLGLPGRFQGLFAYSGAAAAGDYPGSRLRRQRQLLLRTRYQRYTWSLELLYLHNQRRLGAHSGVRGAGDTRYNRLIAQVTDEHRTRRTVRNDFLSTLKTRLLTASVNLSTQSLYYEGVGAAARRLGVAVHRNLRIGRHRLHLRGDAYTQRISSGSALPIGHSTSLIEVQVRDSLKFKTGYLLAQGIVRKQNADWGPGGRLRWESTLLSFRPYAELSHSAAPRPLTGWGKYLISGKVDTGSITQASGGAGLYRGRFLLQPYGFVTSAQNTPDYREMIIDSLQVVSNTYVTYGAGIRLSFSSEPERGLYATLNAVMTGSGENELDTGELLPEWVSSGQVGFKVVLFTGDLRLNTSVRGRSWSAVDSRALHAPTGLLVIPSAERAPVDASYTLDLAVEGGIRTATIYIIYENITSGTRLMSGNELVPDYPLPAQQLRFGVYWPIAN
ncbi:MAG: hypothetical protein F4X05_00720 [Rhodothermaceae bacterium]|nr:hypothetical protein [Rhodothermaceae bacterium]